MKRHCSKRTSRKVQSPKSTCSNRQSRKTDPLEGRPIRAFVRKLDVVHQDARSIPVAFGEDGEQLVVAHARELRSRAGESDRSFCPGMATPRLPLTTRYPIFTRHTVHRFALHALHHPARASPSASQHSAPLGGRRNVGTTINRHVASSISPWRPNGQHGPHRRMRPTAPASAALAASAPHPHAGTFSTPPAPARSSHNTGSGHAPRITSMMRAQRTVASNGITGLSEAPARISSHTCATSP